MQNLRQDDGSQLIISAIINYENQSVSSVIRILSSTGGDI